MNFSVLKDLHTAWRDILVIGKTIERDGSKYHLIGMTLSDVATLYIIEPCTAQERADKKVRRNRSHRQMLREQDRDDCCYLHCRDFCIGDTHLQVEGGQGGSLEYSTEDYGTIQVFLDMMSAGWDVPEWLMSADWNTLQLTKLRIADINKLPDYPLGTPITITHRPDPIKHVLEKTVTLNVGKSRSFYFTDSYGDKVQCHINNVTLIDMWKKTEEELSDAGLAERFTPEQLEQIKKHHYAALEQNCPKGMYYIGIEYECSKDLQLVFYSKQYLQSKAAARQGSAYFLMTHFKSDKETGAHGLPLKGCAIHTPVSSDTTKIPAELFLYYEKTDEWTETVL